MSALRNSELRLASLTLAVQNAARNGNIIDEATKFYEWLTETDEAAAEGQGVLPLPEAPKIKKTK